MGIFTMGSSPVIISSHELPRFLASKWLSYHLLLDTQEWKDLFELPELKNLKMYRSSGFFERSEICQSDQQFLLAWKSYEESLLHQDRVDDKGFRSSFSLYFTLSPDCVVGVQKEELSSSLLIQPVQPCVTAQIHRFHVTSTPQVKVLSGVFGPHALSWGISLSYPQIVQDGMTKRVTHTLKDPLCHNTLLWRTLQKFVRERTIPLPLLIEGKPLWSELRVGRKAASWICGHKEILMKDPVLQIDTVKLLRAAKPLS